MSRRSAGSSTASWGEPGPAGGPRAAVVLRDGPGRARHLVAVLLVLLSLLGVSASARQLGGMPKEVVAAAAGPSRPETDDTGRCLLVGATVNRWGGGGYAVATMADFFQADADMGPLVVRRSFDRRLPADFASSGGAEDIAAGFTPFVSWKPPHGDFRGAAAGEYDAQVVQWARSVPRSGVYATAFHEPENDMTAAEFVALQRHLYKVVKQANPTIRWGPIYMAYWWDPAQPQHYVGDPWAWWPGDAYADFAGLDWYSLEPTPMTLSPSFEHWYAVMTQTGKPLYITEYAQYVVPDGATPDAVLEAWRARVIRYDADWIRRHPEIRMWLYWQGVGREGDWRIRDQASRDAWRAVAASGCPRPIGAGTD